MAQARVLKHAVVVDQGPPERRQHNTVVVERDARNRARLRIVDQTEMDRLLLQRQISMDQHTAGEHLFRLIINAGYFPSCKWALDSNIRGESQSVSHNRADALVRIGLATVWTRAKAGVAIQKLLWSVVLGERKVQERALPPLRHGLDAYQSFESWWHGRDTSSSVPALLADMPRRIQTQLPRSFHYEIR